LLILIFLGSSIASGDEGLLTLSIGMGVSPEPGAIELLRRYNVALNYVINKILDNNLKTLKQAHKILYRDLVEGFDLPSRIALDCYRDALANAKAWIRNPKKGKDLWLRDHQCFYIQDQDIGSKMAM
jgi:putative transposase